ncbi:MAG: O-antigen ligase family protein [Gammaproteobacteria bacterium]|nr:O-antigen ligase family protein [Gammaproteobacteria bacterium]
MPDRNLFHLFIAILIWLPLPAGSNWPWAWGLLQILVFASAFYWVVLYVNRRVFITTYFNKARPVIYLLFGWLIWVLLQFIPLPVSIVEVISPVAAEHSAEASLITGLNSRFTSLSVDPYQTFQQFMLSSTYVVFFMLALLLVNSRARVKLTLWVVIYSALFQAMFGSLMTLSGLEYHLFGPKQHYLNVATGTFINRNHLAGYLVMSLAIGIGLLLSQIKTRSDQTTRQLVRDWIGMMLAQKTQLRIILAILVIGLVMTHSRMGNSAFFGSLLACSIIWLFLAGKKPKKSVVLLFVSLIVIDLYIVGAWFGFEKVVERLEGTSVTTESRDEVVRSLLVAIPEYGWTGSGMGTFKSVYPSYKDEHITISYLYAHNDYLQFVLEAGAGAILLAIAVLMSLTAAYQALRKRRDPLSRGLGFSAMMGVLAILIHSTVDFNLQIPANAMMFILLLSFAWIARTGFKS